MHGQGDYFEGNNGEKDVQSVNSATLDTLQRNKSESYKGRKNNLEKCCRKKWRQEQSIRIRE